MEIICPKCGKHPELVWEDRSGYNTQKIKEYECECGCHFEAIFVFTKINILEE